LKILKCGAGKGWRSVGPIMKNSIAGKKHPTYTVEQNEGRLIGVFTFGISTGF